jgi:hypothetical protein
VGEHIGVSLYGQIDYAGLLDAGQNCDAGACIADIRRWFPGVLQDGQFCRGDGVCADAPLDSYIDAGGLLSGSTVNIVWVAEAGTLGGQVCCSNPCKAALGISAMRDIAQ